MIYLRCFYKYYYVILSCIFLVLCLNVYLVFFFLKEETPKTFVSTIDNVTYFSAESIMKFLNKLDKDYDFPIPSSQSHILKDFHVLLSNLKLKINGDKINLFNIAINTMNENGLMPLNGTPFLGSTIVLLKTSKIIKTYNAFKGTQLKLLLMFEDNQEVLFKPKWYLESEVIDGEVYAGKDRYNAEIVAFYISLIFGFPRVPIVVKRILDSSELHETANIGLKKTMYINSTTEETCVFGKCFYCKREDAICTKGNRLEGAAIFHLPPHLKLQQHLHPWRRTYKKNLKARWEEENNYCDYVKTQINFKRILDFVDIAIFDFVIGNGDRHQYEVVEQFNNTILLIDNGKSFGNPYKDHIDILAPFYQCCVIRQKTWERLKAIKGGTFTKILQEMLDIHESMNIITVPHYHALERRLKIVYTVATMCQKKSNESILKQL